MKTQGFRDHFKLAIDFIVNLMRLFYLQKLSDTVYCAKAQVGSTLSTFRQRDNDLQSVKDVLSLTTAASYETYFP